MSPVTGSGPAGSPADEWLEGLRAALLRVTRRRVRGDAAEDLVQDAMAIILRRGLRSGSFDTVDGLPPLVWSLRVMRNVIGNYYQKQRTQFREAVETLEGQEDADPGLTPLESVEAA